MARRGLGKARGGFRAVPSRDITVSKALSYVLRHGARKEGIKLDQNGYANCADLLSWHKLRSLSVTFPELLEIVSTNDKQRFTLIPAPLPNSEDPVFEHAPDPNDPSQHLIRAAQGHSIEIASENLLTPISIDDENFPDEVVHGTYKDSWAKILATGGLKRMGRRHVHFAAGLPDAPATLTGADVQETVGNARVISGMRKAANALVWVDVRRSIIEGKMKWWRSENGVILAEGLGEEGLVELKWVKRVEARDSGEVIWDGDKEIGDGET